MQNSSLNLKNPINLIENPTNLPKGRISLFEKLKKETERKGKNNFSQVCYAGTHSFLGYRKERIFQDQSDDKNWK